MKNIFLTTGKNKNIVYISAYEDSINKWSKYAATWAKRARNIRETYFR